MKSEEKKNEEGGIRQPEPKAKQLKTARLFYENMHYKEFDAQITKVRGNLIWLDRTAFFPTSGGQAGEVS